MKALSINIRKVDRLRCALKANAIAAGGYL